MSWISELLVKDVREHDNGVPRRVQLSDIVIDGVSAVDDPTNAVPGSLIAKSAGGAEDMTADEAAGELVSRALGETRRHSNSSPAL